MYIHALCTKVVIDYAQLAQLVVTCKQLTHYAVEGACCRFYERG